MKYPLYIVLFILCICRCTHSNAPERGDDRWIQSQVLGYIGRYHEYPSSGEDLIRYYKDAIDIYRDEFDFPIELMVPGPSITKQKRAFLNRYNDYNDTTCTICYKNNKYKFSLSLTEWQSNHYDWIAYYYKPALYDKDGYYLFYLTDQIQDDFNKCLFNFSKSFPNHYKYNAPFPVDSPQMVTIPLRVRVRYERGGTISLVENCAIPKSTYISRDGAIADAIDTIDRNNIIQMIDNYNPFFCEYFQAFPEIWAVDCLIPLCF